MVEHEVRCEIGCEVRGEDGSVEKAGLRGEMR